MKGCLLQADPFFFTDNEVLEVSFETAEPTGTELHIMSLLRFVVLPNEVVKNYFGEVV